MSTADPTATTTRPTGYDSALARIRLLSASHPSTRINDVAVAWDTDGYRVQGPFEGAGWSALMTAEEAARAVTIDLFGVASPSPRIEIRTLLQPIEALMDRDKADCLLSDFITAGWEAADTSYIQLKQTREFESGKVHGFMELHRIVTLRRPTR